MGILSIGQPHCIHLWKSKNTLLMQRAFANMYKVIKGIRQRVSMYAFKNLEDFR